jgi:peptidoglycan/xylan/chitin deacetylase (PgdA/CDA1 family)
LAIVVVRGIRRDCLVCDWGIARAAGEINPRRPWNASWSDVTEVFALHLFAVETEMLERASPRAAWLSAVVALVLCVLFPAAGRGGTSLMYPAPIDEARPTEARTSILVYHRLGPVVADSMTVRTSTFRWQLEYLKTHGYKVIPLRAWIAWRLDLGPPPPARSVVITADDGHRSVFTEMLPLVREFGVPVTLFIYPSAISNAAYAMTWDQLRTLTATGLFDVQSHSYWHPNFATEKRRLPPAEYRAFAVAQLKRSKAVLDQRLGVNVDVIAWPFGVYDEELLLIGIDAGYLAGVTLNRRVATASDPIMALPRLLVTDAASGRHFAALLPSELP